MPLLPPFLLVRDAEVFVEAAWFGVHGGSTVGIQALGNLSIPQTLEHPFLPASSADAGVLALGKVVVDSQFGAAATDALHPILLLTLIGNAFVAIGHEVKTFI